MRIAKVLLRSMKKIAKSIQKLADTIWKAMAFTGKVIWKLSKVILPGIGKGVKKLVTNPVYILYTILGALMLCWYCIVNWKKPVKLWSRYRDAKNETKVAGKKWSKRKWVVTNAVDWRRRRKALKDEEKAAEEEERRGRSRSRSRSYTGRAESDVNSRNSVTDDGNRTVRTLSSGHVTSK
jgi:hypothetical protein